MATSMNMSFSYSQAANSLHRRVPAEQRETSKWQLRPVSVHQLLTYLALRRLEDHQKTTGNCLHMPRSNPAPQQHSVQSHEQDFEWVVKNSQVSLLRWSAWCASSGAGSGSWDRFGTIWRVGEPPCMSLCPSLDAPLLPLPAAAFE